MNEHVFATAAWLNKSEALGRVEPLNSTLSHHVVSAGSKNDNELPLPQTGIFDAARYAVWAELDSGNDIAIRAK
jgi:hypothetical protein